MKKINTILILLSLCASAKAQTSWSNTTPMSVDPTRKAILGTSVPRSLYLVTNDSSRVIVDSLGYVNIPKLSAPESSSMAPLFIDATGKVFTPYTTGAQLPSTACGSYNSWYIGGNGVSGAALIGTCNDNDFKLEAGNEVAVTIKSDYAGTSTPMIGIGKDCAPTQLLDVSDDRTTLNYSTGLRQHTFIHGDEPGTIETSYDMNLLFGHEFHVNSGSTASPGNSDLLNLDYTGNFSLSAFKVATNGTTTIGGTVGTNSAMLSVVQPNRNNPCVVLTDNSTSPNKDFFKVYGSGYTEINLLTTTANDRVLAVRNATNSGSVTDLFVVKDNGKVYAREVQITNVQPFPDYVFTKDYKLQPIKELETYIRHNEHLPGFEKGTYYEQNGINVNTMLVKQQEKIEELTLYIIELEKRMSAMEKTK